MKAFIEIHGIDNNYLAQELKGIIQDQILEIEDFEEGDATYGGEPRILLGSVYSFNLNGLIDDISKFITDISRNSYKIYVTYLNNNHFDNVKKNKVDIETILDNLD